MLCRWQHVSRIWSWRVHLGPLFCGNGGRRGSAIVPLERAIMVFCRLSIVTIALPLTIRTQFAIDCLWCWNQQGWVTLGQNLGRKGYTDVGQILMHSNFWWDMGLLYTKNRVDVFPNLSTMQECDRQTDRPWKLMILFILYALHNRTTCAMIVRV